MSPVVRLSRIAALRDEETLGGFAGTVAELAETPLENPGFSGSRHSLLRVTDVDGVQSTFVLKHTTLAEDWTCRASEASCSREAALLGAPPLEDVWTIFSRPYLAYAETDGEAAFLMEDLTPFLLPDERAPLPDAAEELMIGSLADLHARFMHDEAASLPWLASPASYLSVLDARRAEDAEDPLPARMSALVAPGWKAALRRVPVQVAELLRAPAEELVQFWRGLPHTLVHGDVKVANFAVMPDARLAAFDWAMAGWAPPSVDLGWYLAVNASRIAGPKERFLAAYRAALEERIAYQLAEPVWDRMERHAVLSGARMLLWSKASALQSGRPGAEDEWRWWTERLDALV